MQTEEQKLPPIVDPKSLPKFKEFFELSKQTNMILRPGMDNGALELQRDYVLSVMEWNLSMVKYSAQFPNQALSDLGNPLTNYRGIPVFYVDSDNFDKTWIVIEETNELSVDLEFHQSHSFLGKGFYIFLHFPLLQE